MELIDVTKNQTIGFFTFIKPHTKRHKGNFEFHRRQAVEKTHLMRRYSTQQNVNMKMLWRKVGSKLIVSTPKVNDKNQKICVKILYDLTQHSTKQYQQILQKYFFDWSIDTFQSLIDYIKFSTKTQWRLVTAVCTICPKYTKGIIVRLLPHRVTNWHYVTVEKKENVPWTVNTKLRMQFMTAVSLHQSHKKSALDWQKESRSNSVITIKNHSITNDIHVRLHFQVMCDIWRKL